jgi:hypothetical protein
MYVTKDELDHFEEKCAKLLQIFLSDSNPVLDPDPSWPKVSDPTGSGCTAKELQTQRIDIGRYVT